MVFDAKERIPSCVIEKSSGGRKRDGQGAACGAGEYVVEYRLLDF